VLNKLVY